MINNKDLKNNNGFTLIETIVAITILMISIVGPLALASKGIVYSEYVRDEITAFNLAQEAMETVRNIRDENVKNYSEAEWLKDIDRCLSPKICRLDIWDTNGVRAGLVTALMPMPTDWLKMSTKSIIVPGQSGVTTLYGYLFNTSSVGTLKPSLFTRIITITPISYGVPSIPPKLTDTQGTEVADNGLATPGEVNVTVEIRWRRVPFLPRSIKISENLYSL